jgi:hypothetical protein
VVRRAGGYALAGNVSGRERAVETGLVGRALADGLLAEDGAGGLRTAEAAHAWLRRLTHGCGGAPGRSRPSWPSIQ